MQLHALNLVEVVDGKPISIHSFSQDEDGRAAAEKMFKQLYREHVDSDIPNGFVPLSDEKLSDMFTEGLYDSDDCYTVTVVYS